MCGGGVIIYTPPWRITHLGSCAAAAREKNVDLRVSHFSLWSPKFIASGSACGHKGARFSHSPLLFFFRSPCRKDNQKLNILFSAQIGRTLFPILVFCSLRERLYAGGLLLCNKFSGACIDAGGAEQLFAPSAN